jgi:hypothetical protein
MPSTVDVSCEVALGFFEVLLYLNWIIVKQYMQSFPTDFRALVVGASGTIGAAFHTLLLQDPGCAQVVCLHCRSEPPIDF